MTIDDNNQSAYILSFSSLSGRNYYILRGASFPNDAKNKFWQSIKQNWFRAAVAAYRLVTVPCTLHDCVHFLLENECILSERVAILQITSRAVYTSSVCIPGILHSWWFWPWSLCYLGSYGHSTCLIFVLPHTMKFPVCLNPCSSIWTSLAC